MKIFRASIESGRESVRCGLDNAKIVNIREHLFSPSLQQKVIKSIIYSTFALLAMYWISKVI